jgi:LPXTG-motif cell wall-anchored protein
VNTDQNAAPTTAPDTDKAATATAGQNADQNTVADNKLPQTASPLPLLGLLGFSSLLGGFFARRKK